MVVCLTQILLSGVTLLLFCDITNIYAQSYEYLDNWVRKRADPPSTKSRRQFDNHTATIKPEFRSVQGDQNSNVMNIRSLRQSKDENKVESEEELSVLDPYTIYKQMKRMAKRFPRANISVEIVGRTVEYNDLVLLKVTQKKENEKAGKDKKFRANDDAKYVKDDREKKIILIVHGLSIKGFKDIPALWETESFQTLLNYYFEHLDVFDIFLIPMANPDGLNVPKVFWDKNVSPQAACPGVNLDRNFNVAWNATSISSCSQLYPGLMPFSEVETQVIQNIFHFYNHKIVGFINVKSGSYVTSTFKGEAVLYPKGYTDIQDDDDLYLDLKGEIGEVVRNISFRTMSITVDTLYSWYGPISGSSVDYAATEYGLPYALEFVMQSYDREFDFNIFQSQIGYDSLNVIWKKVIHVVFTSIWKTLQQDGQL